jgi:maltooligosyltrehalose trehalohydrolase
MEAAAGGFFELTCTEAAAGSRYAFRFEDGRLRPDPASRCQPDGVHGQSQLFFPEEELCLSHGWPGRPIEELVFYELHVGTFTQAGTLAAAAERLPDLAELGVTCVELMPLQPFAGRRNWGYDGVSLHAVHEGYGGPLALGRFVEKAHSLGLCVCLDVVFNHLGPEGNYLREFGPYFTARHRSPWGEGIDYDGAGAGPVRQYMLQAAMQWVRDYQVDALRLDAVDAICDDSARHLVQEMADEIKAFAEASGRHIHVIAESGLNDRKVVEPSPLGWGCASAWADDFHHALHRLLTGEAFHFYSDFGGVDPLVRSLREGFTYQGELSKLRGKPHGTGTRGLRPTRFVFCAQNHDQVGNRPGGERLSRLLPFEALEAVAALLLLGPGLPLLFMGEEYGEPRPFLFFTSHTDDALGEAVAQGRKAEYAAQGQGGEGLAPQDVGTFEACVLSHRRDGAHGRLRERYRQLLRLRERYRSCIAREWPQVSAEGRSLRLDRSQFRFEVNLGSEAQGELPAWGWRLSQ